MLIVESLALLVTDDESGRSRSLSTTSYLLAGAILTDLTFLGRIRLSEQGETNIRKNRVLIEDFSPTDSDVLDWALDRLGTAPIAQDRAVRKLRNQARIRTLDGLVAQGVLNKQEHRILGISRPRYPVRDRAPEEQIRQKLLDVFLTDSPADPETAAILAALGAFNRAQSVIRQDLTSIETKQIKDRAKEYAQQHWAARAAWKTYQADAAAGS